MSQQFVEVAAPVFVKIEPDETDILETHLDPLATSVDEKPTVRYRYGYLNF
jgi:hypothetical protein